MNDVRKVTITQLDLYEKSGRHDEEWTDFDHYHVGDIIQKGKKYYKVERRLIKEDDMFVYIDITARSITL